MNSVKRAVPAPPTALDLLRAARGKLITRLKREERKLAKQRADALEAGQYARYGQIADSLMADPRSAPRGTAKASVVNIHTEQIEEISLNPAFDAVQNAELLYRKARKGKRGYDTASGMAAETEAKINKLKDVIIYIDEILADKPPAEPTAAPPARDPCVSPGDADRILALAAEFLPAETANKGKNGLPLALPPFKKYVIDGYEVYLGKNSRQNDELSIHFANPWDVWMHVVGYAGSHLIIRRPKNSPMPPKEVIEKAAQLAVWFSKAKHTSFAEVHITEARFVRKRRHAPAGEVIAERCRTVRVEPKEPVF